MENNCPTQTITQIIIIIIIIMIIHIIIIMMIHIIIIIIMIIIVIVIMKLCARPSASMLRGQLQGTPVQSNKETF
jgi:cellulose synthase/poly-beta-1,6-N-acetylglucosamine synthase-like glycosyltransferase